MTPSQGTAAFQCPVDPWRWAGLPALRGEGAEGGKESPRDESRGKQAPLAARGLRRVLLEMLAMQQPLASLIRPGHHCYTCQAFSERQQPVRMTSTRSRTHGLLLVKYGLLLTGRQARHSVAWMSTPQLGGR